MAFAGFPKSGLAFLRELEANNDRDWFEGHRAAWDEQIVPAMAELCTELQARLSPELPGLQSLPRVGGSIFRLNRDTRFSRDKKPYDTHAAALLWDGADKHACPAIYLRISAAQVLVSGGIWIFEEGQLDRFRKRLLQEPAGARLDDALRAGKKAGLEPDAQEKLPRPPRGIPLEHPRTELSKHKGLVVSKSSRAGPWVHSPELLDRTLAAAQAYLPLHRWLREEIVG